MNNKDTAPSQDSGPNTAGARRDALAVRIDTLDLCAEIFKGPDHDAFPGLLGDDLPALARRAASHGNLLAGPLADLATLAPVDPGPEPAAFLAGLETAYVALFVSDFGGVPAPLYESCHVPGKGRLMGAPAEAMAERLAQAGLTLAEDLAEPQDHLSIELEYLAFALDESLEYDDPETVEMAGDFAAQILPVWRRWAEALRTVLDSRSPAPTPAEAFYLAAARLVLAVLAEVASDGKRP